MAGRHNARAGGLRRVGGVIVEHPYRTGAVATAALVAALVVTPLVTADLAPAPARSDAHASGVSPVVALSVPNVIGLSESRARDTLRERGFSVVFRTGSGEPAAGRTDDLVTRQTPGAGAHAARGATIALTVAPAGSTVSTPPQNAAGTTGPATVSAPAGSGVTPAAGGAGSTGGTGTSGTAGSGAGGAGAAGSGGAVPAPPAPVPAPSAPAAPVTPPPVVQVPASPVPLPTLPTLPVSPLGVVSGLLRGVV